MVSHDAGRVFSIGSKEVQVSAWVLNRVMGVSGSSVPSSFLAPHSLFIDLLFSDLNFLFFLKFKGHRNYFPTIFVHSLALTSSPNSVVFPLFGDELLA